MDWTGLDWVGFQTEMLQKLFLVTMDQNADRHTHRSVFCAESKSPILRTEFQSIIFISNWTHGHTPTHPPTHPHTHTQRGSICIHDMDKTQGMIFGNSTLSDGSTAVHMALLLLGLQSSQCFVMVQLLFTWNSLRKRIDNNCPTAVHRAHVACQVAWHRFMEQQGGRRDGGMAGVSSTTPESADPLGSTRHGRMLIRLEF